MVPAWFAAVTAVMGISLGIFAAHATLGNKITRALTLLEGLTARVVILEKTPIHFHRRATDPNE